MEISITGRNINISEDLNKFIQEKVIKVTKYDKNINLIEVVLLKESRAEKVEIIATSKTSSYIVKTYSSVFEKTIQLFTKV